MSVLTKYRKTIVAVVGAVVLVLSLQYGPDNAITQAVIALATALGVYATPNVAPGA